MQSGDPARARPRGRDHRARTGGRRLTSEGRGGFQPRRRLIDRLRRRPSLDIVFVSGEPETPGHRYRVLDYAHAAERLGCQARVAPLHEVRRHLDAVHDAGLLVIWRAVWNEDVAALVESARKGATPIVFDIDDLLVEPDLASFEAIDGLRSQQSDLSGVRGFFEAQQRTLRAADVCSAPTPALVERMRLQGKPGVVMPNGFDDVALARSRAAVETRRRTPRDGLTRIGYAAGTRTHQRDFAEAADALAQVLATRADVRLVLFKAGAFELVQVHEFPALQARATQIEWREMRPACEFADEIARFDINIAPLQWGNLFCECKSELKFFEAALVDVPTIASPTEPFARAIQEGRNGLLARSPDEWIRALGALIDDRGWSARLARRAKRDCMARYGSRAHDEAFGRLLAFVSRSGASTV